MSFYVSNIKRLFMHIRKKHKYAIFYLGILMALIGHMFQNMVELAETVGTISIMLFLLFGISLSIKDDAC